RPPVLVRRPAASSVVERAFRLGCHGAPLRVLGQPYHRAVGSGRKTRRGDPYQARVPPARPRAGTFSITTRSVSTAGSVCGSSPRARRTAGHGRDGPEHDRGCITLAAPLVEALM